MQLLERIKQIYALRSAIALHGWDQEVTMPTGGGNARAFVMAELAGLLHRAMTAPDLFEQIEESIQESGIQPEWKRCLQVLRQDCLRKQRLPLQLDKALVQSSSLCQQSWVDARQQGDAQGFLPLLKSLLLLKRQEADCLREPDQSRYEALLQSYEPGMTLVHLDPVLSQLETGLGSIMEELRAANKLGEPAPFAGKFPKARQESYLRDLMPRMGFDMRRGRLDASAHPFTEGLHRDDVRITVRYREDDILDAYFSLLHEGGHGLYEQGFAEEWAFTPLAEAVSLGVHESQSRFWENCIGRSSEYWEGEYPLLQQCFPEALQGIPMESFLQRAQAVRPSLIRVQSDEVTYNLHILLRYRLERMMLEDELGVSDLESAWNSGMQQGLGITPHHAGEGYLQDVHWSAGLFGYFPTYTLGNLWSAQIHNSLQQQFPYFSNMIREGRFGAILEWLRHHIHEPSRRFSSSEIMQNATGVSLDPNYFLTYLRKRYLSQV